jgi:hypothetical protein
MKTKKFNAVDGATADCTLWLFLDSIPEEDKWISHGICGNAWLGSV